VGESLKPEEDKTMINTTTEETHPAGALIQISRCSGKAHLFGSDFDHQHYITLKITPATTHRSLARTWYMGKLKPYVEVAMSAAQFAEAITTLNVGMGVPCTMRHLQGHEKFPDIEPISQRPTFEAEGGQAISDSVSAIDEALVALDDAKLSARSKSDIAGKLNKAKARLKDRLPFLVEAYKEHLDDVEQQAKTEIAAYADHVRNELGVAVLSNPDTLKMLQGANNV
jgi:hypothetical protein